MIHTIYAAWRLERLIQKVTRSLWWQLPLLLAAVAFTLFCFSKIFMDGNTEQAQVPVEAQKIQVIEPIISKEQDEAWAEADRARQREAARQRQAQADTAYFEGKATQDEREAVAWARDHPAEVPRPVSDDPAPADFLPSLPSTPSDPSDSYRDSPACSARAESVLAQILSLEKERESIRPADQNLSHEEFFRIVFENQRRKDSIDKLLAALGKERLSLRCR